MEQDLVALDCAAQSSGNISAAAPATAPGKNRHSNDASPPQRRRKETESTNSSRATAQGNTLQTASGSGVQLDPVNEVPLYGPIDCLLLLIYLNVHTAYHLSTDCPNGSIHPCRQSGNGEWEVRLQSAGPCQCSASFAFGLVSFAKRGDSRADSGGSRLAKSRRDSIRRDLFFKHTPESGPMAADLCAFAVGSAKAVEDDDS